jgi:hypothetical protein
VVVIGQTMSAGIHCWELQLKFGPNNMIHYGVCKADVDLRSTTCKPNQFRSLCGFDGVLTKKKRFFRSEYIC